MVEKDTTLGNFHKSLSNVHPNDGIGNQGIIGNGKQVGSFEYLPTAENGGVFDLSLSQWEGKGKRRKIAAP